MNLIENNKLIAEFIGGYQYDNHDEFITFDETNNMFSYDTISLKNLKFHSDWNWLMSVVEKIRNFHNGTEPLNDKQIEQLSQLIKKLNKSLTLRNEVSIQAVYNTCVEFIKWYNLNK